MAVHKIQIIDFLSIDYELIAIHTSIDDYRLAYFINKALNIQLNKNNFNIEIETSEEMSKKKEETINHYEKGRVVLMHYLHSLNAQDAHLQDTVPAIHIELTPWN